MTENNKIFYLILCEGDTDRLLISAYLEKINNWKHIKKSKESPFPNEDILWFKNEYKELGIWAANGNDFSSALSSVISFESIEHHIEKIVIITDYDEDDSKEERVKKLFDFLNSKIKVLDDNISAINRINKWSTLKLKDGFGEEHYIDLFYLVVPLDAPGALETFMLDGISSIYTEGNEVKNQVIGFVENFKSNNYLKKKRDKIKAELGIGISIFNPGRSAYMISEIIHGYDWTELDKKIGQFKILRDL